MKKNPESSWSQKIFKRKKSIAAAGALAIGLTAMELASEHENQTEQTPQPTITTGHGKSNNPPPVEIVHPILKEEIKVASSTREKERIKSPETEATKLLEHLQSNFKYLKITPFKKELEGQVCNTPTCLISKIVDKNDTEEDSPVFLEIDMTDDTISYNIRGSSSKLKAEMFDEGAFVEDVNDLDRIIELKFSGGFQKALLDWAENKMTDEQATKYLQQLGLTKWHEQPQTTQLPGNDILEEEEMEELLKVIKKN